MCSNQCSFVLTPKKCQKIADHSRKGGEKNGTGVGRNSVSKIDFRRQKIVGHSSMGEKKKERGPGRSVGSRREFRAGITSVSKIRKTKSQRSKLTAETAIAIYCAQRGIAHENKSELIEKLSRLYNVSECHISAIWNQYRWTQVTKPYWCVAEGEGAKKKEREKEEERQDQEQVESRDNGNRRKLETEGDDDDEEMEISAFESQDSRRQYVKDREG